MNEVTVRRLAEINRAFYREHASAFSATRESPWTGWDQLLPLLRSRAANAPLRLLDVGCGNGRFVRYLAEALPDASLEAIGVDASPPLLGEARHAGPLNARWELTDVVLDRDALPPGPFELVVLFGMIHGVPGREHRRALLDACARRVARSGRLVFTTWRASADARRAQRLLDWNDYNVRVPDPIDVSQLEPGDHLLLWGQGEEVVRYFHEFDEVELASCTDSLPLSPEIRYRADGRSGDLNEYFVFRAP